MLAGDRLAPAESCVHVYQFGYSCFVSALCFHIHVYNDFVLKNHRCYYPKYMKVFATGVHAAVIAVQKRL